MKDSGQIKDAENSQNVSELTVLDYIKSGVTFFLLIIALMFLFPLIEAIRNQSPTFNVGKNTLDNNVGYVVYTILIFIFIYRKKKTL